MEIFINIKNFGHIIIRKDNYSFAWKQKLNEAV